MYLRFVTKKIGMQRKNSHKSKYLNWTFYNRKMIKFFGENYLAHGKIKFSGGMPQRGKTGYLLKDV